MGVVAEIERQLAQLRGKEASDNSPVLRTSTMTHLVWAPPGWLAQARATLAGLQERHPARTIFLIPEPRRSSGITAETSLQAVQVDSAREAHAEVIEVHLGGTAIEHPASIVLPLLIADLPVFCRWRGEPEWGSNMLTELAGVADRLVVDSSEWRRVPAAYGQLAGLFDRIAVSDIAFSRTLGWRARLADAWPGVAQMEKLRVEGPKADALLLAGWLRSRLKRDIALSWRNAKAVQTVRVDGRDIRSPIGALAGGSDLLSAELDVFGRDPVYEAAARAATPRA